MSDCYYCGGTLSWESDCTFDDRGYEGKGIVSFLHCMKCGADVEYSLRYDEEEEDETDGETD